VVSTLKQSW